MPLVALTDVTKSFDGVRAVDHASFSIGRGEVVGFLGPNGAGKTTTMRLITQSLEPDEGRIEIDGISIEDRPAELRRRIGYLPETNPLYTDMVAGEYLDFMGRLRGMSAGEIRRRTEAVVEQTGIEDVYYRPIDQLSKGYRQRVGLAQAILSEPEILILDEPTEGLDPNQRVEIRGLIRELGAERTVLLSTHVMQEVQRTCGRVVIIDRGRIIADGTVDALISQGTRAARIRVEIEAPAAAAREALQELEGVAGVEDASGPGEAEDVPEGRRRFHLTGGAGADPRRAVFELAAARGWPLWELHLERESLEDLFRELTAGGTTGRAPGRAEAAGGTEAADGTDETNGTGAAGGTREARRETAPPGGVEPSRGGEGGKER